MKWAEIHESALDREMAWPVMDDLGIALPMQRTLAGRIAAALAQARAEEREACAVIAEQKQDRCAEVNYSGVTACTLIAAAIRARGEEP